jgi:hypothetical protein
MATVGYPSEHSLQRSPSGPPREKGMPSTPDDRGINKNQDIRELFARSGKRPTRRFDEIVDTARNQHAHAADTEAPMEDVDATLERHAKANRDDLPDRPAASDVGGDEDDAELEVGQAPQKGRLELAPRSSSPRDDSMARRWSKGAMLMVAILLVIAFGLGVWLGHALTAPEPRAAEPAPAATVRQVCLDSNRLADQVIDSLLVKRRAPELGVLQAYLAASRQCQEAALP